MLYLNNKALKEIINKLPDMLQFLNNLHVFNENETNFSLIKDNFKTFLTILSLIFSISTTFYKVVMLLTSLHLESQYNKRVEQGEVVLLSI